MGVYIDMEMPKDKAVAVVIHPDGTAYTAEMFSGVCTKYLADCTAVPVPAHGRLIDADALMKRMWEETDCMISIPATFVRNAPTVIEAEDGE